MNIESWRMISSVGKKHCKLGVLCEQKHRGMEGAHVVEIDKQIKEIKQKQILAFMNIQDVTGSISSQWGKEAVRTIG